MKDKIKDLRTKSNITQQELALRLGYSSSAIVSMWETGERKPPSDKLPELARILGCEIGDLFADAG